MRRALILFSLLVASIRSQSPCNSANSCSGNGICFGTGDASTCACFEGFVGARCSKKVGTVAQNSVGAACDSSEDCSGHGVCAGITSSSCVCEPGYSGFRCEVPMRDVLVRRAIETAPCDAITSCNGNGFCSRSPNGVACICKPGFVGARCENALEN